MINIFLLVNFPGGNERILLVDGEKIIVNMMETMLRGQIGGRNSRSQTGYADHTLYRLE